MVIDIGFIRECFLEGRVQVTDHVNRRIIERFVSLSEIEEVIMHGEIIEEYPEDKYYPSCLMLGVTLKNRPLHVVVGVASEKIWLVTVYEPSLEKWDEQYRMRR